MQRDIEHTPEDPAQERQTIKREVVDFVKLVVWFLVVFILLRTYVIEGYEVQGDSMSPNLANNERILVLKLPQTLSHFRLFASLDPVEPGDIIVFDSPDNPNKRYVKRVIARGPRPGSRGTVDAQSQQDSPDRAAKVQVQFDHGRVYVANHLLEEPYLKPEARISGDVQELMLGAGEFYVLGDNRPVSKDSRSFDAIHDRQIIGRAVLRFWPPRRISLLE